MTATSEAITYDFYHAIERLRLPRHVILSLVNEYGPYTFDNVPIRLGFKCLELNRIVETTHLPWPPSVLRYNFLHKV